MRPSSKAPGNKLADSCRGREISPILRMALLAFTVAYMSTTLELVWFFGRGLRRRISRVQNLSHRARPAGASLRGRFTHLGAFRI